MKSMHERAERISHPVSIAIPTLDGNSVSHRIEIVVPALRDPVDGEIYFEGAALKLMDRAKARHMGLMSESDLRNLRAGLGLTQKAMSDILQIGAKTYTRWESGGEYPSRSLNLLLCALRDGRINVPYLQSLRPGLKSNADVRPKSISAKIRKARIAQRA